MRHLNGPMEARLRALGRFQARLADDLRALGRDGIAIGQGIWDSWGETNVPTDGGISPSP